MKTAGPILVVDDTPLTLRLLADALRAGGHQVQTAEDGEEALALAAARPPDLVLLDVRMPGMDGFEVCRRLKARPESRDLPILFFSASADAAERLEGFRLGAVDFLALPIQPEELLARVATHLELRALRLRQQREAADLLRSNQDLSGELAAYRKAEADLQSLNQEMQDAQLATLNLMDDALEARSRQEAANAELRKEVLERQQATLALAESHERFELANRATFNVIWDWDLVTHAFWRNDQFESLFGYAREDVESSFESSTTRIHPEDLARIKAGLDRALASNAEFWSDQYRFRRKDGTYATVEDRAVITRDGKGSALRMLGAMRDITSRVEAERTLRDSEEKLRRIIEHSTQLFYSHTPDDLLTYVSPQAQAFFDTDPDDTLRPWTDFLTEHPANAIGVERTRAALETGRRQPPYELELRTKLGRKLWVEVQESPVLEAGRAVAIVGSLTDITESKRAQDQLRLQGGALEAAANAIVITDRAGIIQWANPAFTAITGYGTEEALGRKPGDLLKSGHHDAAFFRNMWEVLEAGRVWQGEIVNRRKDGSLYTEDMTITPLKDEGGEITHFVAVKQDISLRKQAEDELAKVNRSLRMLSACNEALVRAEQEQRLLEVICSTAVELGGYRMAWVGYAREDAAHTIEPMASAGDDHGYLAGITVTWSGSERSGRGPAGQAVRSGQAALFSDIEKAEDAMLWLEAMQKRGYRGVVGLPLRNGERSFGVLCLYSSERLDLGAKDLDLLQEMADDLAFGITNLRARAERRDAEAMLLEQASLLDKAHDAIIVKDLEHRVHFWNKGAERLYGWTSKEMLDRSVVGVLLEDGVHYKDAQRLLLADGEWSGRLQHVDKAGHLLDIECHWTLVRGDGDQPGSVLAIHTNVTEQVKAEAELKQYTERLEAMREIDAALLGARSTQELAQGALVRLRHIVPFERAAVVTFDNDFLEGTILAVDQDSPWRPLPGEIRPIGDFHDLRDLRSAPFLDLKDLDEVPRRPLEDLLLAQGLRNLVYVPMESEGILQGFVALSATQPGLLTPDHAEIALDMTDQLAVALQHTRLKEELERANIQLESKVEKRTAELSTSLATLKVLEWELRQREAEARAASEAKSTFLSSMSHELRTPLIGVTGMLEVLRQSALDPQQRQVVGIIHESSQSLLHIIGDILDFSKIEANKLDLAPQTFSARALVESVSQAFRSATSAKGLYLFVELEPDIAPAHVADAMRLRQILNNFLSNAVKFTESGSITLRLRRLAVRESREVLAFEVEDTGIGISPESQEKLFAPFTQAEASTTRRFGGTGLGLVISRRLADLMGGSLTMKSTVGQGTTMTLALDLPVGDAANLPSRDPGELAAMVPARSAPSIVEAQQEGTLVLLAEDHPTNRIVITQQVNRAGFALEVAEDGIEAFEKWQSGRYALLLTDLHMPRMDGYQLTKAVREWERTEGRRRAPILALTANAMGGEAERCLELGMDDYLIKPVTIPLLAAKLNRWLPQAQAAMEVPPTPGADAPAPEGGAPTLEPGTLLDLCGGDAAAAREILLEFIATTETDLEEMAAALGRQDRPGLVRQAHRIKGSSAMIGALALADRARRLEATAKNEATGWMDLQAQLDGMRAALRALERVG
ncbi:MAG: PAS domain S-box protein [Holophagaceae bacterium]|nr:PAS domain S-box protein [Holophagaceae bacterium]